MFRRSHWLALGAAALFAMPTSATFHFIQVEQIIGGVNGDTTAQAIQIRFRAAGQHLQAGGRMRVWDAAGANPIIISDPAVNLAGPSATGDRVLFASANFSDYLSSPITIDYPITTLIPASYLAAGSLTFENNTGTVIYWRVSWGGAAYTGSNAGSVTNDADGNFGPPISTALPSTGVTAVIFNGVATALSTNNAADYLETARAAVFTNYNDQSATVFIPVVIGACCMPDGSCVGELTEAACTGGGGAYQGDGTTCAEVICPVAPGTGACCMPNGSCVDDQTQLACKNDGGIYQGDDSECATVECTQPEPCIADIVDSSTIQPPPDGVVDGADLAYILGEWGPNPGSIADIVDSATILPPPDGIVDGADLAFLLGSWGPCR